jgi:hypothetical protein
MRKMGLLGLTLLFWALAVSCSAQSSETVTEEEYAVYAAVIEQTFLSSQSEMVVVQYETIAVGLKIPTETREKIVTYAPEISEKMLDALEHANEQSATLDERIPLGIKALVRPADDLQTMLQQDPTWQTFYKTYPNTPGIVAVSRAVFDQKGETALVYATLRSGLSNEAAYFLVLHKENDLWRVVKKFPEWLE